ncbi:MAG: hypothetical protein U9O64_06470 [Campylobacterota bacterium]|nr:hypothetical protein [Campylobacterota bacterium]
MKAVLTKNLTQSNTTINTLYLDGNSYEIPSPSIKMQNTHGVCCKSGGELCQTT